MKFYVDDFELGNDEIEEEHENINIDEIMTIEEELERVNHYIKFTWHNIIKPYIRDGNSCYVFNGGNDYNLFERYAEFVHSCNPTIMDMKRRLIALNDAL